jgi:putative spermidine/putrescine transport system permease protein
MRFGPAFLWLLLPVIGLLLGLVTGISTLVQHAFTGPEGPSLGNVAEFIGRPEVISVFLYTHKIALIVTIICVAVSYPLAVFMALRPHIVYLILIIMPLLISIVVRTYGWIVILGPRGLVNTVLLEFGLVERPLRLMFNTGGVVLGLVHVFIPFAVLTILAVYVKIDKSLSEAATALGANPWKTFTKIVLPLSIPGVMTAATIVYLLSLGAIVTPLLMGGVRDAMIGTMIYNQMLLFFNYPEASAAALVLTLSAAIAVIPFQAIDYWVTRKMPRHT